MGICGFISPLSASFIQAGDTLGFFPLNFMFLSVLSGLKKGIHCCSFVAESEREKEEWVEAIKESIAETLYNYEVAEKIWFNEANRSCADCGMSQPEWASVNLGVVICKKCAGDKPLMGVGAWPLGSLICLAMLDSSDEMTTKITPCGRTWRIPLFLEVGNKNANSFWAANLTFEEELHSGATVEERATFIRRKYRERKYRKVLEDFNDLKKLNRVSTPWKWSRNKTPGSRCMLLYVISGALVNPVLFINLYF
ncbi:hypothetical protein GOODEAATRI_002091 [Goodea atripinnis]|uniref:Arf-GAP domain-containing protein n=1 Tax=Goodea atripinnis TaxID=208336 RepID=A0ABV0NH60_9TELE